MIPTWRIFFLDFKSVFGIAIIKLLKFWRYPLANNQKTREEIILAIKTATNEHDWDEVIKLYKILFNMTDKKASWIVL